MRCLRTLVVAAAAGGCALGGCVLGGLAAPSASAAGPTTVTIVGTSDVYDSELIQQVILPGFEAADPQYSLDYVSKGTGAAIAYAEAGAADGLLVHAESLENQFVDPGQGQTSYSEEPAGRAAFYGDFVLAGSTADPAGVEVQDAHDVVDAFRDVAVAGARNVADFVSRGGTPGTTVEEHRIWGYLVDPATGLSTVPDLTLCKVSAANGGGYSPSTTSGDCPTSVSYPSWYHVTGLTQGPNVDSAGVCNWPNAQASGTNDCYVLTDRGTYDYLTSSGDPQVAGLRIVTRDNAASAPGGATLLTNYFHAYAVNPAAPNCSGVDVAGALAFLDYLTSPAAQQAISSYLQGTDQTAPFTGDAEPLIHSSGFGPVVRAGKARSITGAVVNTAPATPPMADQPVDLVAVAHGTSTVVATVSTGSDGSFRFRHRLDRTAVYQVRTATLQQVEDSSLTPPFSDLLAPASVSVGRTVVVGQPLLRGSAMQGRRIVVHGVVAPEPLSAPGTVTFLVKRSGTTRFRAMRTQQLEPGQSGFAVGGVLPPGNDRWKVRWAIPGQIRAGTSPLQRVHVE